MAPWIVQGDMMNGYQLTKIRIAGFKSIEKMELDMAMLNVFIGSNGAGKTNLISLFSFLQAMLEGRLQLYIAKHGGPDAFLYWGRQRTENIRAEFYFGINGYGFELEPTNDNKMMFADEWFYWNMLGEKHIGAGHMESAWKTGTHSGIDQYVQSILSGQKWRVYHFHDTSDTAKVKQIHGLNDNIELAMDARNLAAFLYRLRQTAEDSYAQITSAIRLTAPYFDDFILRSNPLKPDSIVLEWKASGSDIPFNASQLSDGTLRFICLATLLLQPEELKPETILIDEPELGLHPYAVAVLAGMIKKAAVNSQIIVSTQSVELLNEFSAENVVVVEHDMETSEFIRLDAKRLANWLQDDYTLGDLWKHNLLGGRP